MNSTNKLWLLAIPIAGWLTWLILKKKGTSPTTPPTPPTPGEPPPGGTTPVVPTVTVTFKASNYGGRAKYWVVLTRSIVQSMAVPITQAIVLTIPADDLKLPTGHSLVDMFDGDPAYGGQSLRNDPNYPNLAVGLTGSRDLVNGETLTWVTYPNGWWRDEKGEWF